MKQRRNAITYECDHSYLSRDALNLREVPIPTLCSCLIACSILIVALVVIADFIRQLLSSGLSLL